MAVDFSWKQHDLRSIIQCALQDSTGTPVDLTGATSVKFIMAATVGGTPKITAAGAIVTPASGLVSYTPTGSDTDTPGTYFAEWEVTWPTAKPQTFPNPGYLSILITADLG